MLGLWTAAEAQETPIAAPSAVEGRVSLDAAGYADSDHVFVLTPSVSGTVSDPVAGWNANAQYLVDVVSAASVDIVSTASRSWVEVRHAGSLAASYKPDAFGVALNGSVSNEPDYFAWSVGGTLTQDLLDENLTLLLGFNHSHDVAGRAGTPFSVFSLPLDRERIQAGASLLLDRATLAAASVDLVFEDGDPSKPYRYVPMFAPDTSLPAGASVDEVDARRLEQRPREQLPLSRQRYALTLRLSHRFSNSTLRVEERLYRDSWALTASSTDARYLIDVGRRWELGPHVRAHGQNGVRFWQRTYTLRDGFNFPALRTGDRELGPLLALTLGLTVRFGVGPADDPNAWLLGLDLNATDTRYLDALYIRERLSALAVLSIEARL